MFRQQTISIPEKLCAFIRHVWLLEPGDPSEGNLSTENLLSIYADGCPGVIFQQSENGLLLNQNVRKTSLQGNIARFPETSNVCRPSEDLLGHDPPRSGPSVLDNEPPARSKKKLTSVFIYGQTVAPIDALIWQAGDDRS